MKSYFVYILANDRPTLYVGVTNDLRRRVYEHKEGRIAGFTKTYDVKKLVFFEETNSIESAIAREKQLKSWRRQWKLDLIEERNPKYDDLYESILN